MFWICRDHGPEPHILIRTQLHTRLHAHTHKNTHTHTHTMIQPHRNKRVMGVSCVCRTTEASALLKPSTHCRPVAVLTSMVCVLFRREVVTLDSTPHSECPHTVN
jgi:hypothetical protein